MPLTRATGTRTRSEHLLSRARKSVAGGDSSTMRVLPYHPPLMIDRGKGCHVWDVDGNDYIDLNMAYGPLLFGHCPSFVIDKVVRQLQDKGSQLGFPQELNFLVAEKVKQLFPSIDLLRFTNSGTEAVAASIRLARAFTRRPNIILFEGHYHGWSDAVFHKYHASEEPGREASHPAISGTEGMNGAPYDAFVIPWNDAAALSTALESMPGSVAAVLMEPVMGNAGVIPPLPGYLSAVRDLTSAHGTLLIFDEVITGLRVAAGGAQQLFGVKPDLTVLSKALGAGFPIAAFGGAAVIMELVASGRMFHGGVYAGNAMVLAAADAVLSEVLAEGSALYSRLNARADQLAGGLGQILRRHHVAHVIQHVGPMIAMTLTRTPLDRLVDYREVRSHADFEGYIEFQHALLDNGVYIHPNQFEPMYLSTAHGKEDIEEVLSRFDETVQYWQH